MGKTFKEAYCENKRELQQKRDFAKFQKQFLKLEKSVNEFHAKRI